MAEVEAQAIWCDERTALLNVSAENGAMLCVQQMRRGVVAHNIQAARAVYLGGGCASALRLAFDYLANVNDQAADGTALFFDVNRPAFAANCTRVADLSPCLDIEASAVQHHFDPAANFRRLDLLTVDQ